MILLRSTVTFWRCAAKKYHLFVIFAVLDLRVAEVVLKRRFKLLSFFTIILYKLVPVLSWFVISSGIIT